MYVFVCVSVYIGVYICSYTHVCLCICVCEREGECVCIICLYIQLHTNLPDLNPHPRTKLTNPNYYPECGQVLHPNITDQGQICLDLIADAWNPAVSLRQVMM